MSLLGSAESKEGSQTRVSLLVSVRNTHTPARSNIEALQLPILVDNSDEAYVIGKHIHIIGRRYRHSHFELRACQSQVEELMSDDVTNLSWKVKFPV